MVLNPEMIRYGEQCIDESDIRAVEEVLRSDFLTQGPACDEFEQAISKRVNANFVSCVTNATSALHLACLALDVGPGDLVWTTPVTFVASSNCALYCGADVDFVDIDLETINLCPEKLEQKLMLAKQKNRLPKLLIVVHLAGTPCDMGAISKLARTYGFRIVEDASHGIGSSYREHPTGSCSYSDMTVFSFHPVKIITTAEGGAITTNNEDLFAKIQSLRSHGITRQKDRLQNESHGGWYYEQHSLGYNYRMTDVQAALGSSQLSKLDDFIGKRHEIAARYDKSLSDLPIRIQRRPVESFSSLHLYIIQLLDGAPMSRRQLYDHLIGKSIGVNVHYIPVHLQPFYLSMGFARGDFVSAEKYYDCTLSLPLHPKLTVEEQEYITGTLRDALE